MYFFVKHQIFLPKIIFKYCKRVTIIGLNLISVVKEIKPFLKISLHSFYNILKFGYK